MPEFDSFIKHLREFSLSRWVWYEFAGWESIWSWFLSREMIVTSECILSVIGVAFMTFRLGSTHWKGWQDNCHTHFFRAGCERSISLGNLKNMVPAWKSQVGFILEPKLFCCCFRVLGIEPKALALDYTGTPILFFILIQYLAKWLPCPTQKIHFYWRVVSTEWIYGFLHMYIYQKYMSFKNCPNLHIKLQSQRPTFPGNLTFFLHAVSEFLLSFLLSTYLFDPM